MPTDNHEGVANTNWWFSLVVFRYRFVSYIDSIIEFLNEHQLSTYMESIGSNFRLTEPTQKELEVLKLLATGSTSKQIADSLGISIKTVETHRKNMQRKFDAINGCHLVYKAAKANII